MPKKLLEINKFVGGVVSTPSATDTEEQSAKYSKNIDPQTADGRLQSIDKDKILAENGFIAPGAGLSASNVKGMESVADKFVKDAVNLVMLSSSNNAPNKIDKVSIAKNIYSSSPTILDLTPGGVSSVDSEYDMNVSEDKVYIGLGGSNSSKSKVVMRPSSNGFLGASEDSLGIFDAELRAPNTSEFNSMFSELMTFPIHTDAAATTAISKNDTGYASAFFPNHDAVLDSNTIAHSLATALKSGTSDSTIKGFKIGQVFRATATGDFDDDAMHFWKKYDYDADASGTMVVGDLFMFCGYISGTTFPILRYLGNDQTQQPAFMYAIKEGSSELFKIGLGPGDDAYDGNATMTGLEDESGNTKDDLTSVTSRYTSIDLDAIEGWSGGVVTAFSACSSPPLYNNLNLEGALNANVHAQDGPFYYNNGHLKIYYRHGVFYVANQELNNKLYRLNAIDFHQLGDGVFIDEIELDFSKIPSQLHAEDGAGIVRRTIEDQLLGELVEDPKNADATWSNIPIDAEIIGITETFDCGRIKSDGITDMTSTYTGHKAWKIETINSSRLTTGDKVRFAGMSIDNAPQMDFNTSAPFEISVVDDGQAFLLDTSVVNTSKAASYGTDSIWWNAKVWILYGKKSTASFSDWDLFLYNANTLDMDSNRVLDMADRTPPYHQARYYEVYNDSEDSIEKLWYPGQFAFVKTDRQPGVQSSEGVGLELGHVKNPKGDIRAVGSEVDGNFCEFGIYDKSGRWASNGVQRVTESTGPLSEVTYASYGTDHTSSDCSYRRPKDWVGGQDGPISWPGCHKHGGGVLNIHPNNSDMNREGEISGDLIWGQNIGWSIDGGRDVSTIKNSLHPLVPYSSLYNGNFYYKGFSFTWDGLDDIQHPYKHEHFLEASLNNNKPKHAVTFLGKVTGDFIVQPGRIGRQGLADGHGANLGDDMDRAFKVDIFYERIKTYQDDITLFTIDDFSGHRGSVIYGNDDALDITEVLSGDRRYPAAGVEVGRPNWGGPEIENPRYRGVSEKHSNGDEVGSLSSVNGGYSSLSDDNTNNTGNDRGWDGYTPPYLFNPGSGYYVYINRSWKNMSDNHQALCTEHSYYGHKTNVWGFQTEGLKTGSDYSLQGTWASRWHNFSNTALSDTMGNGEEWVDYDTNTITNSRNRTPKTRFYSQDINMPTYYGNSFAGVNPSIMQAVCTMNALDIQDIGDTITSISPIILHSNLTTTATSRENNEFNAGYLCAFSRENENLNVTDLAYIRTNFDSMYHQLGFSKVILWVASNNYFTNSLGKGLTEIGPSDGTNYAKLPNRGTHYLEIFNITDSVDFGEGSDFINSTEMEAWQLPHAKKITFSNSITGDRLVMAAKRPWNTFSRGNFAATADVDVWYQVNDDSNLNLWFGNDEHIMVNATMTTNLNSKLYEPTDITYSFVASNGLISSDASSDILQTSTSMFDFSKPSSSTTDGLEPGDYYYKVALEYDDLYESPLSFSNIKYELDAGTASLPNWAYIKISIKLPNMVIQNLSKRATGIVVYRRFEGGTFDSYYRVGVVKFTDIWNYDSSGVYISSIYDRGNLQGDYFANNGIEHTVQDTSLNYGLSAVYKGYMFVSKASHPKLSDVKHYIFRSQPGNYFAFNWVNDFAIMPEVPKAMASFNDRLYVWGVNTLYKLDPHSLLIEDEYEGISILNKDCFIKTEYGLFFADSNNIYIHDGSKPTAIGDQILYSSNDSVVYNTEGDDGYIKLEQGYRELATQTIENGHTPHLSYSGKNSSILVHLSDSSLNGKILAYNIRKARWDLWDSPKPFAVTSSRDSDIIIADGSDIYNYQKLESDEWATYNRREWDWFSKNINFNTDTQDKVFRSLKLAGTPSVYNISDSISVYDSSNSKTASIQAFVDDKQVDLTVKNKFYDTLDLAQTYLKDTIDDNITWCTIRTAIHPLSSSGAGTAYTSSQQAFIRDGHLIKIDDEIMLVTATGALTDGTILYITRGVMGTTAASHTGGADSGASIEIVSPTLKFPAGTKGKNLSIRLLNQKGYIDSIGVVYKPKSIK